MKIVEKEPITVEDDERAPKEIHSPDEFTFPEEYAVSGWFKWTGTE